MNFLKILFLYQTPKEKSHFKNKKMRLLSTLLSVPEHQYVRYTKCYSNKILVGNYFSSFGIYLLILFIHCSQPSKESTNPNEVKYVFAAAGLRLREAPDLNAKSLVTIPYGSMVEIIHKTGNRLSINYYLSGEWVEAKWKDKTGYAFDGYLLNKKEFAQFDKVFQFIKRKILQKIKNNELSSQYRIEKGWEISHIQFNQKKSNSNFIVYTFMPTKSEEGCSFYMSSNCINVILDDKDNIVFTDLDFEPMGMIEYIDEEFAKFGYSGGEGDGCSSIDTGSTFVYIFSIKTFIKDEWNIGKICIAKSCGGYYNGELCSKWGEPSKSEFFFNAKHEPIEPSAKIKEYFKRTNKSENK